ncbi:MAG: hypothetical protein ACK5U4_16265 [Rhodospirillales bacterium]|jgi:hypothetical protein
MATIRTITTQTSDPLGYDGDVLERVRKMALDAVNGVNADAVKEEAAILRARLKGSADPTP